MPVESLPPQYEPTLAELEEQVKALGRDPADLEPVFARFLLIADRYARLEKMVLGSVPLSFPAYLLLEEDGDSDPLEKSLRLARRERERLGLGHGAADDLVRRIEAQGVKVIGLSLPEESDIMGAFVFNEFLGPAILVNAGAPGPERDYALIHEYGHFLADNDPYRTFVCSRGLPGDNRSEELRAHAFAGAFLVPEADLDAYLEASGLHKGEPVTPELLRQLRAYFDADDRAIVGRLLASKWLNRSEVGELLAETGGGSGEPREAEGPVSARFLSLLVMARREGRLSLEEMAHYLQVDEPMARRIERSFSREGDEEPNGNGPD